MSFNYHGDGDDDGDSDYDMNESIPPEKRIRCIHCVTYKFINKKTSQCENCYDQSFLINSLKCMIPKESMSPEQKMIYEEIEQRVTKINKMREDRPARFVKSFIKEIEDYEYSEHVKTSDNHDNCDDQPDYASDEEPYDEGDEGDEEIMNVGVGVNVGVSVADHEHTKHNETAIGTIVKAQKHKFESSEDGIHRCVKRLRLN